MSHQTRLFEMDVFNDTCFRDSVSELAQFGFVSVTEGLRLVVGSLGLLSGADCQYACI